MNPAFEKHLIAHEAKKRFIEGSETERIAFCEEYLQKHKPKPEVDNPFKEIVIDRQTGYIQTISPGHRRIYNQAVSIPDYVLSIQGTTPGIVGDYIGGAVHSIVEQVLRDDMVQITTKVDEQTACTIYYLKMGVFKP